MAHILLMYMFPNTFSRNVWPIPPPRQRNARCCRQRQLSRLECQKKPVASSRFVVAEMNSRFGRLDLLVCVEPKLLEVCGSNKIYNFLLGHLGENMMHLLKEQLCVRVHVGRIVIGAVENPVRSICIRKIPKVLV